MSYFSYVQDQGYKGNKIFDKYGNFSKAFKKFVVEKKGKINLPQDWVYLPERPTHKFIYKPTASKRVKKVLLNRFVYTKKEEKHTELSKSLQQRKLNIEKAAKLAKRALIVTWSYKHRFKSDEKKRWYGPYTYQAILPPHYKVDEYAEAWLDQYEQNNSIKTTVIVENSIKILPGVFVDNEDAIVPNIRLRGGIMKYEGMRGVGDISYKTTNNECVYQCWEHRYTHFPVIRQKLFSVLCDKYEGLKKEDGVSPNMLLYACQTLKIPFYAFDVRGQRICKYSNSDSNYPVLICYCANEHMYLVTDKDEIASIVKCNADKTKYSSGLMVKEKEVEEREYNEYIIKEWDEVTVNNDGDQCFTAKRNLNLEQIQGGNSYIYQGANINEIFYEVVKKYNIIPKCSFTENNTISKMNFKVGNEKVYIERDPNYGKDGINFHDIKELVGDANSIFKDCIKGAMKDKTKEDREKLRNFYKFNFTNQGVGTLTKSIYDKHRRLSSLRKTWTLEEKIHIKNACLNQCRSCKCNGVNNTLHIDHIVALANGGTNDIKNLQLLCVECHERKTKDELKHGYNNVDPITSSFCGHVWEIFRSDDMMKWAFTQEWTKIYNKKGDDVSKAASKYAYDIKRERKNNMYYSKYEWPVFTVMDKVQKYLAEGDVNKPLGCGYYYVVNDNLFPLRGNGWYSEPMVDYCLGKGIISFSDIKYVLRPSIKLPSSHFKSFIDFVYDKFPKNCKTLINAFIGTLFRMKSINVSGVFTESYDEACAYYFKNNGQNVIKASNLYTVFFRETVEYQETEAPIYLQIMDMEALELHKLADIVGQDKVTYLKTDCVYCTKKVDITGYFWDTEGKEPKYQVEEITSFPFNVLCNYRRMDEWKYNEKQWEIIEDNDDFDKIANTMIEKGQGFNIDGPAGTGKTWLVNRIKENLDIRRKKYICLAPTHCAARLIKGSTFNSFIGGNGDRLKSLKGLEYLDYIIVDEISMMREHFYKCLLTIKKLHPNVKVVMVGDFRQLPVVNDRIKGDYSKSLALKEICDYNQVALSKCRRSDVRLFEISQDVEAIEKSDFGSKKTYKNICFTNATRRFINNECMNRYANLKRKYVKIGSLKISEGMPIICKKTIDKHELINNEFFTVDKVDSMAVWLKRDENEVIEFGHKFFLETFELAFAITVHCSQGLSIDEAFSIWEWEKFSKKMKYTAITRARRYNHINLI